MSIDKTYSRKRHPLAHMIYLVLLIYLAIGLIIGNCPLMFQNARFFNPYRKYKMNGNTMKKKDLGVIMDLDLKFHKQSASAIKKANVTLGLIKKSFALLDHSTQTPL